MAKTFRRFNNQGDQPDWSRRKAYSKAGLITHDGISQTSYSKEVKRAAKKARRKADKESCK